MRRQLIGIFLLATVWLAPRTASAQAKMGDHELLVFANISTTFVSGATIATPLTTVSTGSSTTTSGNLFLNAGQFLTDQLEVGGGPNISISSGSGSTHADFGINVFGRYYFNLQNPKLKPYVGAEYIVTSFNPEGGGSVSDNQFIDGVGGIKDYLSEKTALDIKASYGFNPSHPGDLKLFNFSVGLTYLF